MNLSVIWLTVLCVVIAGIFTFRRAVLADVYGVFLKTGASLCCLALGFVSVYSGGTGTAAFPALLGLCVCLTGDIFLDLKYTDSENSDLWTFGGFGSFITGHILFICCMAVLGGGAYLPAAVIIGLVFGGVIYVTPEIMKLDYGRFRLTASCYAAVLIATSALAVLRAAFNGGAGNQLMAAGLVLFLLSDLVLSRLYFGKKPGAKPGLWGLNHGLYYAAVIMIALSLGM